MTVIGMFKVVLLTLINCASAYCIIDPSEIPKILALFSRYACGVVLAGLLEHLIDQCLQRFDLMVDTFVVHSTVMHIVVNLVG